ncbi:hypothetical protein KI387_014819, partial [Taxus chinensis]
DILTNDDFRQERLAQLELLDERRLTALDHLQIYQNASSVLMISDFMSVPL